jgi:hypothetical protein
MVPFGDGEQYRSERAGAGFDFCLRDSDEDARYFFLPIPARKPTPIRKGAVVQHAHDYGFLVLRRVQLVEAI